jgi:hypothetical protein
MHVESTTIDVPGLGKLKIYDTPGFGENRKGMDVD